MYLTNIEPFCILRESVTIDLHDEREPSQTTLNILLAKPKTAKPDQRLSTICVMHQTSGKCDSNEMLQHILRFTSAGFLVVAINSRYHGCRSGEGFQGKERYLQALVEAWKTNSEDDPQRNIYPFIYDTVADLGTVADYLLTRSDVNPEHLGITGISLGGMHAWFAGAADPRWTAVAPLIGVQSFGYAVAHDCYHARVDSIPDVFYEAARDIGDGNISCEVVRTVWDAICPGLLDYFDARFSLALLSPRPTFVGNGEVDSRCPIEGVKEALKQAETLVKQCEGADNWHVKLQVYENVGHQVTEEMWADCVSFFVDTFGTGKESEKQNKIRTEIPSTTAEGLRVSQ